jgi:hypothetical protein
MADLPDNVYVDILVTNFQSSTVKPQAFNYTDNRSIAFLESPSQYELSILRFQVDSANAVTFLPSIEPNQTDPTLTIYSITMEYPVNGQTVVHQEFLKFNPQDKSATIPVAPSKTWNKQADFSTGYYSIYNYEFFLFNVNTCMTNCFNNLKTKVLAINPMAFFPPNRPFITWDTTQNVAVITAESLYFDESPLNLTPIVRIYMNPPMFNLFSSFPMVFFGFEGVTFGRNFLLGLVNIGTLNQVTITVPYSNPVISYNAIQSFQEYSTVSAWSPIQAIVFTSNTLQVQPTNVSPTVVITNNTATTPSNNSATANIITDLVTTSGQYSPSILYTPTAQYRMISLSGSSPLTNLDIQIYYRLRDGSLIPFVLSSGGSVSLKLGFFLKK